ncbi:MAG: DoxX family protein [Parcubacteria group bacterium]|nr:DoxX family protein [Parcubacteria group bacterium]
MLFELSQYSDIAFFILRLVIAAIFIYHALPKLKNKMGSAFLVLGAVEGAAGAALVLGFFVQLAALLLAIVMASAIWMKITKWHSPFSAMDKTGWELDLILLAANIIIFVSGGGAIGIQ